jgi:diaminohydroxyphosphoribosylaminopyrimidine deaminase / 5-amino-6-(5-phosphoribosylamino)uracil reductase
MINWSAAEVAFMQHALGLAALGMNTTDPNPRVGCVLVRDGQMVGEGWHERPGGPHAEVSALQAAGVAAEGATAYVTLEPCAAHGRTPPCTDALINARVARVVYAAEDPNPRMRNGAQLLRAAGITVHSGLLNPEARDLNPGFFKRHETGLPWVRLKLAVSLDGRTALANGESRWITGTAARKDSQRYRARSSVVLTGVGTVLTDNPALNVRLEGALRQPLRVVLDSQLRSPPESRMFHREGPSLVLAVNDDPARRAALNAARAEVEIMPADSAGRVTVRAALQRLAERSVNEVWVEAGAVLSGALLASGLVDELIVYYAPCLLGSGARGMADLPALTALDARLNFRIHECQMIGEDLRITARPCLPV